LGLVQEGFEVGHLRGIEDFEDHNVPFGHDDELDAGLEAEAFSDRFWNDDLSLGGQFGCGKADHRHLRCSLTSKMIWGMGKVKSTGGRELSGLALKMRPTWW
jgi:hypothetical protein